MNKNFVFRKLSPELEEVLLEELHTLKGGTGGGSDVNGGDLGTVDCVYIIPKEEEEETPDPTDINNPHDVDYEEDDANGQPVLDQNNNPTYESADCPRN